MMGLWIIVAVLTLGSLAAILWPLVKRPDPAARMAGQDADVYRDQLNELESELARGQIGKAEAAAARNEIARRLLASVREDASEAEPVGDKGASLKRVILTCLVGVPALSLAVYLAVGMPMLPGLPHAERMANALENRDYDALVEQVEAHLANAPEDVQGWSVLAPIYVRQGRYADAANAYTRIMALTGERPDLLVNIGEALVLGNNGIVTDKAREAVDRALALDPRQPKARFYQGLAAKQDGNQDEALRIWRGLLEDSPADAPWRQFVERNIATTSGEPASLPGLSPQQVEAVTSQDAEGQQAMIRDMVEGLHQRLEAEGGPVDDWIKLARARVVLGDAAAARAVLDKAAAQHAGDNAALTRIDEARRDLGLTG